MDIFLLVIYSRFYFISFFCHIIISNAKNFSSGFIVVD